VGPVYTDEIGWVTKNHNSKTVGYGLKFFFYQMIAGDPVDNIPGLPKMGDVKAFTTIRLCESESELFYVVKGLYKDVMGDKAKEYFQEQKDLLWIKQEGRMEYKYVQPAS
jgi:5'-3' exonuclease